MNFLMRHSAYPDKAKTTWIAGILVAGCLGDDHLWQDLGLWSRKDLSGLIAFNFPQLAAMNRHDIKWKNFCTNNCANRKAFTSAAPLPVRSVPITGTVSGRRNNVEMQHTWNWQELSGDAISDSDEC